MRRLLIRLALLAALMSVGGSSFQNLVEMVTDHRIALRAIAIDDLKVPSAPRLRLIEGWTLESDDVEFGGLSGLLATDAGLLVISDKGALIELQFESGVPLAARIRPLPGGCGESEVRLQRDTESLARDNEGAVWIGFEYRNAICRIDASLTRATALVQPNQMRGWPHTGGAEAMTRLRDGRFVILAERGSGQRLDKPLLVFDGDPTRMGTRARELRYLPPPRYRPTEIAELPDGSLLILHRRFRPPLNFSTILSVMPAAALDGDRPLRARAIALLKAPGIHENFEALAVEEREGRITIWLASDDNFSPLQKTYLLKFELLPS